MAEIHIFGNLPSPRDENRWTLDYGHAAAEWYYHTHTGSIGDAIQGAHDGLQTSLEGQMQTDDPQQITPTTPTAHTLRQHSDATITSIVGFVDQMQHHYALYEIGFASSMIDLLVNAESNTLAHAALLDLVRQRLDGITSLFPTISIKPDQIYMELWNYAKARQQAHFEVGVHEAMGTLNKPFVVLSTWASPKDQKSADVGGDDQVVSQKLYSVSHRYVSHTLPNCRRDSFEQALTNLRPAIIHFTGHGDSHQLAFEDKNGNSYLASSAELTFLLGNARKSGLRTVVLSACCSRNAAQEIADVAGFVVCTENPVFDNEATTFASHFYRELAGGHSVQGAFDQARSQTPNAGFELLVGE